MVTKDEAIRFLTRMQSRQIDIGPFVYTDDDIYIAEELMKSRLLVQNTTRDGLYWYAGPYDIKGHRAERPAKAWSLWKIDQDFGAYAGEVLEEFKRRRIDVTAYISTRDDGELTLINTIYGGLVTKDFHSFVGEIGKPVKHRPGQNATRHFFSPSGGSGRSG